MIDLVKEILLEWGYESVTLDDLSTLNFLEALKVANGDYYEAAAIIEDYILEMQNVGVEDEEE